MFDTFKFNLDSIDPTVCFDIYFETVCSSLLLTHERHIPNTTATTFLRVLRLANVFRKRLSFDKVETKIFAKGKACLKSSIKPPSYNSCNPMIIQSQCERLTLSVEIDIREKMRKTWWLVEKCNGTQNGCTYRHQRWHAYVKHLSHFFITYVSTSIK